LAAKPRSSVQIESGADARSARSLEDDLRVLVLLFPQVMWTFKRSAVPDDARLIFADTPLGPRHLMPIAYLLHDGPMSVNELARRLGLAPATTSLMVSELSRSGFVDRREDQADRRRTIVSVAETYRAPLERWLAGGEPMRRALVRLSASERAAFTKALAILEEELREYQPEAPEDVVPVSSETLAG
jgi:DNA-binding MarR family transcriptional regulator